MADTVNVIGNMHQKHTTAEIIADRQEGDNMLYEKKGNLVTDKSIRVFCHQTNCFGTMKAGIARQIAEEYPGVEEKDKWYMRSNGPGAILGTILPVPCLDRRTCINMYSQYKYGTKKRMTDYTAMTKCFSLLERFVKENVPKDAAVGFPYMMGCGLGGGDWNIVKSFIQNFSENVPNPVYIVELEK